MTSLPMPPAWPEPLLIPDALELSSGNDGEHALRHAFRSFAATADALERSYGQLRSEVERLRGELEDSNSGLARSLEENRSMRTFLDRILEGLPCGVLVVTGGGEISRINPEALRLLAPHNEPRSGQAPTSLLGFSGDVRELLERARTAAGEHELAIAGEAGAVRWLAARHAPLSETDSSVFIVRDVSERRHLEETQARLRREQALSEMSAVLAHEIRNPLGSLELFVGLLAETARDGESRHWVEQVQAGLRLLAATVNNVLHFHSLPEPELAPVDLGHLLDWARDFFLPLARQSRVELSLRNRVSGVILSADRHRLEQVLLNLVLNAARAMPGGGWIELGGRTVAGGSAVSLIVADTGPGISPEHLPSIFEPGFSTRAGSTGLGLAVCRKIVEQHGGAITAASRPGCGATFTMTFPLGAGKLAGQKTGAAA